MKPLIDPDRLAEAKSDLYDMASVHEEMNLAAALQNMPRPVIPATGNCLYCDAPLADGLRWCPGEAGEPVEDTCMHQWQHEQTRKAQRG